MTGLSSIRLMTGASLVAAALAVSGCASNTTTYGTGISPGSQTLHDLASIVTLGGHDPSGIDYTPRAPIVTPPSTAALPPPEDKPQVATSGDWPNDPDQISKLPAKGPNTDNAPASARLLADDPQIRLPRRAPDAPMRPMTKHEYVDWILGTPEQNERAKKLFAEAKKDENGSVDPNGNPVRRYLTEPPPDYRAPDPTAPTEIVDKPKPKPKLKWAWPWQ